MLETGPGREPQISDQRDPFCEYPDDAYEKSVKAAEALGYPIPQPPERDLDRLPQTTPPASEQIVSDNYDNDDGEPLPEWAQRRDISG